MLILKLIPVNKSDPCNFRGHSSFLPYLALLCRISCINVCNDDLFIPLIPRESLGDDPMITIPPPFHRDFDNFGFKYANRLCRCACCGDLAVPSNPTRYYKWLNFDFMITTLPIVHGCRPIEAWALIQFKYVHFTSTGNLFVEIRQL